MKSKNYCDYYLGLDIGTNSVGYAVTDTKYNPLKHKGEIMLGTHTFESASDAKGRRSARCARRLTDRKKQRVRLLQEMFCKPIAEIDPHFFMRLKESALYKEDKNENLMSKDSIFADQNYTDKDYHNEFPTIHHLINSLMQPGKVHDVRLVYLACAYLVAHRGHFLSEVDKDNISEVRNFNKVYTSLMDFFAENELSMPWECDENKFAEILNLDLTISNKTKKFKELLWNGRVPKDEEYPYDKELLIKLLCGGNS